MRGATNEQLQATCSGQISIHAPHAGSDPAGGQLRVAHDDFNPRSPCGERPEERDKVAHFLIFQSTLPMRGATEAHHILSRTYQFQSTLPMRGATHFEALLAGYAEISIHAPHAGSDKRAGQRSCRFQFQSTLPMRGATGGYVLEIVDTKISIHAPHAGSDRA